MALARALAKQPRLVLADEPTSQLDAESSRSIATLIRELALSGTAVLVATHSIAAMTAAGPPRRALRQLDQVLAGLLGPAEPQSSSSGTPSSLSRRRTSSCSTVLTGFDALRAVRARCARG